MDEFLIVRCSEIYLKSYRSRNKFEPLLEAALRDCVVRNGEKVSNYKNYGPKVILSCTNPQKIEQELIKVPGVDSVCLAKKFEFTSTSEVASIIKKHCIEQVRGKVFAVKVRSRVGKHEFKSSELARIVGEQMYEASAGVDLTNPEACVFLEIRNNECFFYMEHFAGRGGIPPLTGGRVLMMFSGGMDSPVAAIELLKRGVQVDFLFINLLGEKSMRAVSELYNYVVKNYVYGYTPKFYVAKGLGLVEYIREHVEDKLRQIALKIAMYQLANTFCKAHMYLTYATGEALNQKSSQTDRSICFIDQWSTFTVFRPLLTFNKEEIIVLARSFGTCEYSEKVKELCNISFGPVITAPKKIIPLEDEAKVDKPLGNVQYVDMRLELNQKREKLDFDISIPFPDILKKAESLNSDLSYIFVCEYGIRSEEIAYSLRKKGMKVAGLSVEKYKKYVLPAKK